MFSTILSANRFIRSFEKIDQKPPNNLVIGSKNNPPPPVFFAPLQMRSDSLGSFSLSAADRKPLRKYLPVSGARNLLSKNCGR